MDDAKRAQRSAGVRRLSLVLGCLVSLVITTRVVSTIAEESCGLSRFVGFEDCELPRSDLTYWLLERVVASAAFQGLLPAAQVQSVHERVQRGSVGQYPDYRALSEPDQRAFAEYLLAKYHPSRVR
jgi:hypothetical protein